ncbi:MAG TPA: fused MFS/spermidine synthase [Vicinamibacterales bacterium]|nr:fused MFS/spermidine synthase [Vicinamibacterales bacterium]
MRRGPFLLLFALSGAAALVYEVVWTRLLALQIGHGLAAASTVLAAFMGGLAIGAAAGGRIGQRLAPRAALRGYALLEAAIAAVALLLPWILLAFRPLLAALYADGAGGLLFAGVRLAVSLLLLALPAAAMGATFPLASRWIVRSAGQIAVDAGHLYAANTLGAAVGAIVTGFVLLPAVGLTGATIVGVILNLTAATGAWMLARKTGEVPIESTPAPNQRKAKDQSPTPVGRPWLAAATLGVTGLASLTLQVVWTRLLASILGPTTYAFSAVVAIFILGIAGGSAAGARISRRTKNPIGVLALVVVACAAFALAAAMTVDPVLLAVARLVAEPNVTFDQVLMREWSFAAGILLPMALAFGAAFPLALAVASRDDASMVSDLGLVYAVNTTGAIVGALAAGFVLVPWLGLFDTIRMVVVLTALCGVALAIAARRRTAWLALGLGIAVLTGTSFVPRWDARLLSSGGYKYAAAMRGPDLLTGLTAGELVYYREGATATVAVRRLTGATSLSIDGKVDASDAADMLTQRMLAHVPLLLHPAPKRAAILGLGSGVTLGSALTHGLDEAVVLEISPEVVEASRFFEQVNHRPLADSRTRLIVGDGRTHLLLGNESYDVIVSEPSNPWMAGIASLFTREFFEIAKSRLAPGGVLCQWAHTYDISEADLRSIVATFLSVFPDGTMWVIGEADVLLVGSTEPLTGRIGNLAAAWQRPGVAADLAGVGARSPLAVLSAFVAEGAALRAWAEGAPVQTDDRAHLEFSGPRSVFGGARSDNARRLRELAMATPRPPAIAEPVRSASAESWRDVAEMLRKADAFDPSVDLFARVLRESPRDRQALDGLVQAAVPIGRIAFARDLLRQLAANPVNVEARLALSHLLASEGDFEESARIALGIVQSDPNNLAAVEQLASVFSDAGDAERLAPAVARLRAEAPDRAATRYYSATLAYLQERPDVAVREAEAALVVQPDYAPAQNVLGAALAGLGQRDRARAAFEASLKSAPRDPATHSNLAMLELESGNTEAARRHFAEALMIDPGNAVARDGLSRLPAP